jgi:L-seryl-tRNA(Ser) seleniumtransferase
MEPNDRRSLVPSVERLLAREEIARYCRRLSRPLVVKLVVAALEGVRRRAGDDGFAIPTETDAAAVCLAELERADRRRFRKVVNCTGAVLHAGLGRSPLSPTAWRAAEAANVGYGNLEFDLDPSMRGGRGGISGDLLCLLTGAEAAAVTNNGTSALLLALSSLCAGREVLVSRGEVLRSSDGFDVVEAIALSGVRLRDVGAANVTTIEDYLGAVGPDTAAVLLVRGTEHSFEGYEARPEPADLARALPAGLPLLVDQGTGCTAEGAGEPVVRFLRAGARLVCFSADKVLGGPQAGIVVGDAGLVAKLAAHPLMRALQPGKTVLSLLEATLIERLGDENGSSVSPAERALSRTGAEGGVELKSFGRRVLKRLPKERARLVPIPEGRAASWAIELQPASSPESLRRELLRSELPVAGTIAGDRVLLDLLAAVDEDPAELAESIAAALSREAAGRPSSR